MTNLTSKNGALRLVLGDQLTRTVSSLKDLEPKGDVVLFAEVMSEATYVRHHKQKFALVFSAMRQFAEALGAEGVTVRYVRLEDPANTQTLQGEVLRAVEDLSPDRIVLTEPGEWRLVQVFDTLAHAASVPLDIRPDDRFVCPRRQFEAWAADRSELRMEYFYREMRRQTGLLMDGDKPAGGQWNFDAENRKRLPKGRRPPRRPLMTPNATTCAVIEEVEARFPDNFGTLAGFNFPTNAEEADLVLKRFLHERLPFFGDWQDYMAGGEPWMWHAHISAAMNIGLLDPLEVCRLAETQFRRGLAPLNAVEGFIRQIIGWREFVRGVYWLKGPDYAQTNALSADRRLPWFYWTGETDMACVRDVVKTTRDHAYAHHIQRLMVTGNLALLLGVHPSEVNAWYMAVFADAFEWVELPNTHGMAIFADGGVMASKPYAASGAYIHRMSDYCAGCAYDVKDRLGEKACPFNALYWDFLDRNIALLGRNQRLAMPYRTLQRMDGPVRRAINAKADALRVSMGAEPQTLGAPEDYGAGI